jgi:predicted DNA-binding transcriptional regulator YafY
MSKRCDRADVRKSKIVASLRRGLVKAETIAAKLKVSTRTIYRDIERLRDEGEPIVGEAGVGYMLRRREARHVEG